MRLQYEQIGSRPESCFTMVSAFCSSSTRCDSVCCSVVIRDSERFSYITGRHVPTEQQAEAILAWFDLHGATENGEVPFREWPDAMRGHFIARIPPVQT